MLSEPLKHKLIIESNNIVLKNSPIFCKNFSETVIEKTVTLIKEINFPPDECILNKNFQDNDIYFLEKGKLEIYLINNMNNKKIPIKILSEGDSFGEREFFTGE